MNYNIPQLKALWNKERDSYKVQEIGSGVQKFVKEVLKSGELFNLSEGILSTDDLKRKNEFLEEKTRKKKRADIIIFIDPDIIIPVEVERFGNIHAGEEQLYEYQRVWNKKYGLVTDGYEWIFHNNKLIVKRFKLDSIFNKPHEFLEFWTEYTKPLNYYLQFFEKSGQLTLLEEDISVGNNVQDFFNDITTLIKSFRNKLNIKGYFEKTGGIADEKLATEITYAYIIQFILYKTLVDNDFEQFREDFDARLERIYKDIKSESYGDALIVIRAISEQISKNIYRLFRHEQEFINKTLEELLLKPINELSDITPWLDIFVFIKRYNFANVRNEIFGYIYENYLKELFEESKKGQYFTDPAVVNFMLKQIGYTSNLIEERYEKNKNSISLIDPACGSGTFMYCAVNEIVDAFNGTSGDKAKQIEDIVVNNVFGLDIAEFPLYLAEMSILMRMLPLIFYKQFNNPIDKKIKVFLTRDSISEFMDTTITSDVYAKYGQLAMDFRKLDLGYESYVREKSDLEEMKKSLENQRIPRRRFDYVIGNPPYVPYNECARQNVMIVELIKQKRVQMSDIYGVNLNTVPRRIKPYSPKPNLYAFFIALGIALLKDKGRFCYIVPQTMLTANDLDVVRYHLSRFTTLEKIIIFSGKVFIGRGLKQDKPIATSSLIFVLTKRTPSNRHKVKIINYEKTDDTIEETLENILCRRNILEQDVLQSKLLQRVGNWSFIKQGADFIEFYEKYEQNSRDISSFRSQLSPSDDFTFDGGVIVDDSKLLKKDIGNCYEVFDYKNNDWNLYSVSKSSQYYSRKSPFSFPGGSQGLLAFQKKYKILWRTRFSERFQFTNRDILLINNQSLLVSSNSKNELIFYFAIMNSPITRVILEKHLKQENERNYFVPLKAVKSLIRVPYINKDNQFIKVEIIRRAEELLKLKEVKLSDLVDFSNIMVQKFDSVEVRKNTLLLSYGAHTIKLAIKGDTRIIANTLANEFKSDVYSTFGRTISLVELRNLPIIDLERQGQLKNYIDALVFALYFDIPLKEFGVKKAEAIHKACSKSKYYHLLGRASSPR